MPYLKPKHPGSASFCRTCGTRIQTSAAGGSFKPSSKDPDELTGNGIGAVFAGDGFLMAAVILSATQTSVSSLLWLLLLIPAFFFFGKGFSDVFHARQIRRRIKQDAIQEVQLLHSTSQATTSSVLDRSLSGGPASVPSVTERTTRSL